MSRGWGGSCGPQLDAAGQQVSGCSPCDGELQSLAWRDQRGVAVLPLHPSFSLQPWPAHEIKVAGHKVCTCVDREARLPAADASAAGTMPGLGACAVSVSAVDATRCSSCPRT